MKRNSNKQKNNKVAEPKRSGWIEEVDVLYKCGHEGRRREIVHDSGIGHQLEWIGRNVKCPECYEERE